MNPTVDSVSDESGATTVDRATVIERELEACTADIRLNVTKAVRDLLGQAQKAVLSKDDCLLGEQTLRRLTSVLRDTAALMDSLHELARSEVQLSATTPAIARALATMIGVCNDTPALARVGSEAVKRAADNLDQVSDVIEKSEEILRLADALSGVEIGVNNLAISKEDFRRLAIPKVEVD